MGNKLQLFYNEEANVTIRTQQLNKRTLVCSQGCGKRFRYRLERCYIIQYSR